MMIDFFIIGTQKGGTTALHSILKSIDGIEVPSIKEVHFFDNESTNWHQPDYKILHKHFNWENKDVIRGEATPIYSYWAPSIERIHAYNPDAKIIMLLRHPAYRAHSHWCMEFQRGKETLQFSDAISERGLSRVTQSTDGIHRVYSYIERGFYSQQIKRLKKLFPNPQIFFLRTDALWSQPQRSVDEVTQFLGVCSVKMDSSNYITPSICYSHAIPEQYELPQKIAQLTLLYKDDILATEKQTRIQLSDWLDPNYVEPMCRR
jgi:hypothetical protein